jgi:hypothetical protein
MENCNIDEINDGLKKIEAEVKGMKIKINNRVRKTRTTTPRGSVRKGRFILLKKDDNTPRIRAPTIGKSTTKRVIYPAPLKKHGIGGGKKINKNKRNQKTRKRR